MFIIRVRQGELCRVWEGSKPVILLPQVTPPLHPPLCVCVLTAPSPPPSGRAVRVQLQCVPIGQCAQGRLRRVHLPERGVCGHIHINHVFLSRVTLILCQSQKVIQHGTHAIVTVPSGQVCLVWHEGNARILGSELVSVTLLGPPRYVQPFLPPIAECNNAPYCSHSAVPSFSKGMEADPSLSAPPPAAAPATGGPAGASAVHSSSYT